MRHAATELLREQGVLLSKVNTYWKSSITIDEHWEVPVENERHLAGTIIGKRPHERVTEGSYVALDSIRTSACH